MPIPALTLPCPCPAPPLPQAFLLLIAFIAVPCMLFPKPLILKRRNEALVKAKGAVELVPGQYGMLENDDDEEARRPAAGGSTGNLTAVRA